MGESIDRELGVHGRKWGAVHGGYFGDPAVAAPLVATVAAVAAKAAPDVLVDLGGGTGFLLCQVMPHLSESVRLVVLDLSHEQLTCIVDGRVYAVQGSVSSFMRGDIAEPGRRVLFTMRSVLHYAGRDYGAVLRHLRSQMREGEYLVHQTACFDAETDAACLNRLYDEMGTGKYYPTVAELTGRSRDVGFEVESVACAPKLRLCADELAERYSVGAERLTAVSEELFGSFPAKAEVLEWHESGFAAYLHYRILVYRAV